MTKTVLILGSTGKIGTHSAQAFAANGWNVRKYDRATDLTQAAMGVDVIVNGLNPPAYKNWAENIPKITRDVIKAAKASGATVIIPGNVYNFGDNAGVWDENTPQKTRTKKGNIRIEMERTFRESGVPTIVLRAGNFIDPERNDDVMSVVLMRNIAKGKLTMMGRAGATQAYCFLPDWARAAVALANKRTELAKFEDIPFPGHSFTMEELKEGLEATTGPLKFEGFPWWMMAALAPFWELARELREMRYLWNLDHQLSGKKFAKLLPDFDVTPLATVMIAGLPDDTPQGQAQPA